MNVKDSEKMKAIPFALHPQVTNYRVQIYEEKKNSNAEIQMKMNDILKLDCELQSLW